MKVGDKVRFLNEVGGGIVKKLIGKDQVSVEDEDGFEIPILARDCVVINTDDHNIEIKQTSEKEETSAVHNARKPEIVSETGFQSIGAAYGMKSQKKSQGKVNVLLAFVPNDLQSLSATSYEVYLINDCDFNLYFTVLAQEGMKWRLRAADQAAPGTKIFLGEIGKENLDEIAHLAVQLIPYKTNECYDFIPAMTAEMKIDLVKFYKLHAFQTNDFFDEPALIIKVVEENQVAKPFTINAEQLKKEMLSKISIDERPHVLPARKKEALDDGPLVVDLHIDSLLDVTNGMSNKEILEYQLKKFNEVMEENKKNKTAKIVFIHGKGNGVLREKILEGLKYNYKNCSYQDASFQQYGFGATQVTIH